MQICEVFHTFLLFTKIYKIYKKKSIQSKKRKKSWELPWWCSGWEFTCQCRGHGFDPSSRKIPHVAEHLSLCATAMEVSTLKPESHTYWSPGALEPVLPNKRSLHKVTKTRCSQIKMLKIEKGNIWFLSWTTFQVLRSHRWPAATILASTEHSHRWDSDTCWPRLWMQRTWAQTLSYNRQTVSVCDLRQITCPLGLISLICQKRLKITFTWKEGLEERKVSPIQA